MTAPTTARPFGPQLNDWLEERFAEELPPCEVRSITVQCKPPIAPESFTICKLPSVAVLTFTCPCGPFRLAACADHVRRYRSLPNYCNECLGPLAVGGLS